MAKTLLYRLFGIGKIPDAAMDVYRDEGLLLFDEGIRSSVTYWNFRGGGRIYHGKRQWFGAAIVLTKKRIVAYRGGKETAGMDLGDPRLRQMEFLIEKPETLLIKLQANVFDPEWRGTIEYRFRTSLARDIVQHLTNP